MYLILIILVILLIVGVPQISGPYHNLGYMPSGIVFVLVVVLLVWLLLGHRL